MPEAPATARQATEEVFLDAAERLLVEVGYAGITTRGVAVEAGANKGLVHYYFGSMENLLVRVLERFTERLIVRQRAMYAADLPFIEKWRQAMRYLDEDREYQKVWYELQALAWNRPELRVRVAHVDEEWRAVLAEAFEQARREHRDRHAGRRARLARRDVQRGDDPRASLRYRHWSPRAARLDRRMAGAKPMTTTVDRLTGTEREQTRARYPDREGYVERDGVRVFYEIYGTGEPTVLFMPTWEISPLPHLEDADAVPRSSLSRRHFRPPR